MKDVLVLDNYDSFTYNLVGLLAEIGGVRPRVARNDALTLDEVDKYQRIVLSPGPGLPQEAGIMPALLARYAATKRILGVCLGHQAIAETFGARLSNMSELCHGLGLPTHINGDAELFRDVPATFQSGRYHSWTVAREGWPDSLEITATDDAGRIMALRHRVYDVRGVQFHPESVLTEHGATILRNWLQS